jgi:hypothetical protein
LAWLALGVFTAPALPLPRPYDGWLALATQDEALVVSQDHGVLFRWSLRRRLWEQPVRLRGSFRTRVYPEPAGARLLIAYPVYPNGSELVLQGAAPPFAESPLALLAEATCGAAWLDLAIAVCLRGEAGDRIATFSMDGVRISEAAVGGYAGSLNWDPVSRRLFAAVASSPYLDDLRAGWLELDAEDHLGAWSWPPTDVQASSVGPSPDGARLLLDGTRVCDSTSWDPILVLPSAGDWWGDDFFLVRSRDGSTRLDLYGADGSLHARARFPGHSLQRLPLGDRLLVGTQTPDGFRIWSASVDDFDGDGVVHANDAFPEDPEEWNDRDGDGVGDNADQLPDDPTSWKDRDGDGVGDESDAFPYDPSEWRDGDSDGVGDNADAFPDDPFEAYDSDGDGVADGRDWAPYDPDEAYDTDSDGVGDNADAFPLDPAYAYDSDGDGIPDGRDLRPFGEPFLALALNGEQRLKIFGLGYLSAPFEAELGLVDGGLFAACTGSGCFVGTHTRVAGRRTRYDLALAPEVLEALDPILEQAIQEAIRSEVDRYVSVLLEFKPERARSRLTIDRDGDPPPRSLSGAHHGPGGPGGFRGCLCLAGAPSQAARSEPLTGGRRARATTAPSGKPKRSPPCASA